MILETFAVGALACNCTIVADERTREAIVVDGGDGVDEVMRRLDALGLRAVALIHTHAHIDHIGDLGALRERTGARGLLHPADLPLYRTLDAQANMLGLAKAPQVVALDGELLDGDTVRAGEVEVEVLHTPGHTPGSVCFAVRGGDAGPGDDVGPLLLTGDTLFAGSIGRWDIGGTSMQDIVASIRAKLLPYPDATSVTPGHGPATTIGHERAANPYLQ